MKAGRLRRRLSHGTCPTRAVRPRLEGLEDRFLLYATTGTQWAQPKRITYSFVPDGTSIGGVPSNLQATLNAQLRDRRLAGAVRQGGRRLAEDGQHQLRSVSDNGSALGVSGNQQSDPRFGDIRIGGYAMAGSILAFAYLPPPANGGTNAGDIFFNTRQSWQINGTTYDLMTVAIHEFGHALGMDHSHRQHGRHVPGLHRHQAGAEHGRHLRRPHDLQLPPERLLRRQRRQRSGLHRR